MNPAAHLEEDYDFERRYWYYGLHSWPQMLARSPHGLPFARQSCYDAGYPASKALIPIDPQHPICRAWRDGLDEEVIVVLSALLPCAWSVVPLRIGENPRFAHTVLFVAVEEGSTTTAEQGKEAVARLVALLESKGLIDVDVEVHESSYIELGRLYDHTYLYFAYGSRDDEPDRSRVHLSSAIGAQISLINDPRRYGTANAWLDCGPPERRERFLLTCGHVLREDEAGSATGHGAKSNASRARPVAQFIGENFDDCVQECKSRIESTLWTMAKLNERYGTAGDCNSWPSLSSQAMRTAKSKHEEYRLLLDEVTQKFGEAHQHIIGDLHATSARLMAYEGSSWMCDWALIRPDPEVFRGLTINERSSTSFTGIVNPKEPLSDGTAVPSDIFDVAAVRAESRVLYKVGAKSSSKGCVNSVCEARVRLGKDVSASWTSQLVVFDIPRPYKRDRDFSLPGDSGGLVADRAGNVMGMVVAGQASLHPNQNRQKIDLTFVTPIGAILKDLERAGFQNSTIAPGGLY